MFDLLDMITNLFELIEEIGILHHCNRFYNSLLQKKYLPIYIVFKYHLYFYICNKQILLVSPIIIFRSRELFNSTYSKTSTQ